VLADREVDVGCIQEMRWRGSGCRFFGAQGKSYKLFWIVSKDRSNGVGTFVADKWVDRQSESMIKTSLKLNENYVTICT